MLKEKPNLLLQPTKRREQNRPKGGLIYAYLKQPQVQTQNITVGGRKLNIFQPPNFLLHIKLS